MATLSNEPLQPNPFITYRDPETGLWLVVKDQPSSSSVKSVTIKNNPVNSSTSSR